MTFKILSISILILTFTEIISGINHKWDADDQSLLFWSDVDKINDEMDEESSNAGIENVARDKKIREKWAQDTFLVEFEHLKECKVWNDLQNAAYEESWSVLCYQLWDKHANMKRGQECSATKINKQNNPNYFYRVVVPNRNKRYKVELLKCKCPKNSSIPLKQQTVTYSGLYFFVTPCATFNNSYYILKAISRGSLEVFDIQNTIFNPAHDIHLPTTETNVQTFGRPGTTGNQNESEDELEKEKLAKTKFVEEFGLNIRKPWHDLRNEAYEKSWPQLCFLLLNDETKNRTVDDCETILIHEMSHRFMRQRVVDPRVTNRIYVDLLLCNCSESIDFYVTKSLNQNNSYYLISKKANYGSDLEVYDVRSVSFKPRLIL